MDKGVWIPKNNHLKSRLFICSKCGGIAQDRFLGTTNREKIVKKCNYSYCPHCGSPMGETVEFQGMEDGTYMSRKDALKY